MKVRAKFTLALLCVAVTVAGVAAIFVWEGYKLLSVALELSNTSIVDQAICSDDIRRLLNSNGAAIEEFVAAKKLDTLDPAEPAGTNRRAQVVADEMLCNLALMREKMLLCKELGGLESELASHEASVKQLLALADTDIAAATELAEGSILPNLRQKLLPEFREHTGDAHRAIKRWAQTLEEGVRAVDTHIAIIGLGILAIVLAIGLALARSLTRRIRCLTQAAAAFGEGDLSQRVTDCGKNGLGTLASTFNQMAENMQSSKQALENANKTMERRIQKRALQLEQANDHLRQAQLELVQKEKMSMLGQLAASMAHEVNTPTGAILNASTDAGEHLQELLACVTRFDNFSIETCKWLAQMFQILFSKGQIRSEVASRNERRRVENLLQQKGYGDCRRMAEIVVAYGASEFLDDADMLQRLSDDSVLSVLEHVLALEVSAKISQASARKIARIVRSLRVYAHDDQRQTMDVDVNESIDNTLVIMHGRIKCLAKVKTLLGEGLPPARCGAELLQVWTNILSNACDAIEESGKKNMGLIEITSRLEGEKVVVTMSDDGPPIPEDIMKKMFDPFFTTKRIGKGMGLGLSICSDLLRQWGGTISARNESGRVTFEISLPTMARIQGTQESADRIAVGGSCEP